MSDSTTPLNEKSSNIISDKQIIAQNIAFFRKKLGISQTELAKRLQYSNKNISKWEHAETTPDIFTLKKLANIFGTTVDTLINPITEDNKTAITTKSVIPLKWKVYMLLLIDSILFLLACVAFFILVSINFNIFKPAMIFLYILPAIALTVFIFICCVKHKADAISLSIFGWLITICMHMSFINYSKIVLIYVIAFAYQILVLFLVKLINSGKIIKLNKIFIKKVKNKAE